MKACKTARVTVQHGIDAGQLHLQFGARSFDRIVFNFPHTGKHTVDSNRTMLRGLFKSAWCFALPLASVYCLYLF